MPKSPLDLCGSRFGYLTVVRKDGAHKREPVWLCRCDCGTEKRVIHSSLMRRFTRSCGCATRQMIGEAKTLHGHARKGRVAPEFIVWQGMIARCEYRKHKSYRDYGGRGVRVCVRWKMSFEAFLADMGKRPTARHQIERIDNGGPYAPHNCTWATRSAQARNRRSTRKITARGKTQSLAAWAAETGVHRGTIASRLGRGWSAEDALYTQAGGSAT